MIFSEDGFSRISQRVFLEIKSRLRKFIVYLFNKRQFFLDPRVISFLRRVLKFNYGDYGKHVFSNSIFKKRYSFSYSRSRFFSRFFLID